MSALRGIRDRPGQLRPMTNASPICPANGSIEFQDFRVRPKAEETTIWLYAPQAGTVTVSRVDTHSTTAAMTTISPAVLGPLSVAGSAYETPINLGNVGQSEVLRLSYTNTNNTASNPAARYSDKGRE